MDRPGAQSVRATNSPFARAFSYAAIRRILARNEAHRSRPGLARTAAPRLALAAVTLAGRPVGAPAAGMRRIAILWGGGQPDQLDTVRSTLAREGFVEGRTLTTDLRELALDGSTAAGEVEDVLRGGAEIVLVQGPVVPPVHRAVAQRVPTVIAFSGDVVAAGLVDSLRHPGRRTTGVSFLVVELVGKRLEMLVEAVPTAKHVGVLLNSRHYGFESELAATQRAAQALRLTTETFDARGPDDFGAAFEAMARSRVQGVVVFPDALMSRMAPTIATFAIRQKLPVVAGWVAIARGGALASTART